MLLWWRLLFSKISSLYLTYSSSYLEWLKNTMWPGSICLTPSFERVGRIQRVLLGMTRSREIDLRRRGLSGRRYYTLESKVEITYPRFWRVWVGGQNLLMFGNVYVTRELSLFPWSSVGVLPSLSGSQQFRWRREGPGWVGNFSVTGSTTSCSTVS